MREWIEGRLCEKGLMKERYDENVEDLVRTLTPSGESEVKRMLEDPKWRIVALAINKGFNDLQVTELANQLGL